MKILIIDDELVSQEKMKKIMSSFAECHCASNGEEALVAFDEAIAKNEPFDLMTLDISMPGIDGTEVLFKLRAKEKKLGIIKANQVKVIMVTVESAKDTIIACVQAGCNNYIVKPFDKELITKKLKALGIEI